MTDKNENVEIKMTMSRSDAERLAALAHDAEGSASSDNDALLFQYLRIVTQRTLNETTDPDALTTAQRS